MNFYKLYNLLNEYGQSLIQTLIEKFKLEEPALTPNIIKDYIDRFERIKNNLPEKDITKYSWKDLEIAVDSYQPKQRIKAGTIDPTVTDANLLYNQDGIRIYLGLDKKSCIKYGNGYSFCISSRGHNNMYSHYRVKKRGTPYFIFNDKLPKENPDHVLVLFVYDPPDRSSVWDTYMTRNKSSRYTITNALNKGEEPYDAINYVISYYPWLKPIKNFVDDENKGTVDIDPLEMLENLLSNELSEMKDYGFYLSVDASGHIQNILKELFTNSSPQEYKDFLDNKSDVAFVSVFSTGYGWYDDAEDDFMLFYKSADDILKELKERSTKYVGEDFEIEGSYEKVKEDIINSLKFKFSNPADALKRLDNFVVGEDGVFGVFGKSSYRDSYFVKISSPREFVANIVDENKDELNKFNEYKLKYNKVISWIKSQSKEKLKEIVDTYNSERTREPGFAKITAVIDLIISFMNK
jgi:hypothetical protein